MFFKKKKGKTPKTSNRKVVPNMKPIEELRTNKDVAESRTSSPASTFCSSKLKKEKHTVM